MTNYKKPAPLANDAVWTEVWKDGESYGQFRVKHQDLTSPEWSLNYKRMVEGMSKADRHRADNPKTPEEVLLKRHLYIRILATHYITDSKIIDADGNELSHNFATIIEMLMEPDLYFVAQELDAFSTDEANFKAKEAAKEAKKN